MKVAMAGLAIAWLGVSGPALGESAMEGISDAPTPVVTVIGFTPAPGSGIDALKLPFSIQTISGTDLSRIQALDLSDALSRRLAGVTLNDAQNNPLQSDLQFRGFTATPLLGGSQGIAVYVDGVRVNEVFGDTVNWDLIPQAALSGATLFSGANPVFGLNTLGGALSVATKTGFSAPHTSAAYRLGDFGRHEATLETGDSHGEWGWYVMGSNFDEDGWRDLSPSRAANGLGTLSWHGSSAQVDLHLGRGKSRLIGNGPAPIELLSQRRQAIFTAPDETRNTLTLVSLQGLYTLSPTRTVSATIYHRRVNSGSYNGDGSDAQQCADNEDFLCDEGGEPELDQHGAPIPSRFDAINNISARRQRLQGGTLQLAVTDPLGTMANNLVVGAELLSGRLNFDSAVEASSFTSDRSTIANTGVFIADGSLAVGSATRSSGLYLTDNLSVTQRLALTISGRWNRTRIGITDLSGENPDLNGRHHFSRLNPAVGLSWQLRPTLNLYGGYSESTRAPTPVELTCADETAPCKLPNQFLADPPLKQVVAQGWELGVRGLTPFAGLAVRWHAGLFTTTNAHDILFQVTGGASSNEGFFANVGNTRRRGLEASVEASALQERLHSYINYTYLDATYRSSFLEVSANHPLANAEGIITVSAGDRIPGLPRHAIKLGIDYDVAPHLRIGGDLLSNTRQYLRSDEANLLAPLAGFTAVNLRAQLILNPHIGVFAQLDNVFNRHYATFGTLGEPQEIIAQLHDPRFISPAQPRAAWLGVRITL